MNRETIIAHSGSVKGVFGFLRLLASLWGEKTLGEMSLGSGEPGDKARK